ncbi:hypothetical protein CGLO_09126 [Colletotrichum gloeosporioides Cg-14]|uniref:Nucleoside phosphorylase domain-containing protein n=1 Tax=Colletotrichum gloeosporioides (strain Cg-14) TaxID=1237896 RepID=T0LSZ0_COLGC|nr:hypothetical protein CGLO_09126 [Colletotrichum gloeosporioides Cg-14]
MPDHPELRHDFNASEILGGWRREPGQIKLQHTDYTVGWICALPVELTASLAMLDRIHQNLPTDSGDTNAYTLGNIGTHNIVMAVLPMDQYGLNNASNVAGHMRRSFTSIRFGLMVGVGGGVPDLDIRLGDVVVGNQVVQHDLGKIIPAGLQRTATARIPPPIILNSVSKLRALHETQGSQIPSILRQMQQRYPKLDKYSYPTALEDRLFRATYDHDQPDDCSQCSPSELQHREPRPTNDPQVHYGGIASGSQVIRSGRARDEIANKLGVSCFEMEAAGLIDHFACIVIRGICDYADSHKNKQWQKYASATAAAYAKEFLLSAITPNAVSSLENPKDIEVRHGLKLVLETQPGHRQDLARYIHSHLRADDTDAQLENIRSQILDKAGGVFMWVVLVVATLNKEFARGYGRTRIVQKRLNDIPTELSDLFKDILTRDNDNMEDLLLCIQWVLFSESPLRPEEFYFAMLSGSPEDQDSKDFMEYDLEVPTTKTTEIFITGCSKGLVEIAESKIKTVQFIHESVTDFLIKDNGLQFLWPRLAGNMKALSHERLRDCCLSQITETVIRHGQHESSSGINAGHPHGFQRTAFENAPFLHSG